MRHSIAIALIAFSLVARSDALKQFEFADQLAKLGKDERAGVEYLRVYYNYSDDIIAELARYRAAVLFEDGDWDSRSQMLFSEIIAESKADSLKNAAMYRHSLLFFKHGDSRRSLELIDDYYSDIGLESRISLDYLRGWNYFWLRDYSFADGVFCAGVEGDLVPSFAFMADMCSLGEALPNRSPWLAASMSAVMPGAGRAYLGRWGDALVNLVAVGGSFAGGYYLWDEDRSFSIGLIVSGVVFYIGNVYGSFTGAEYYNEQQHRNLYKYAKDNAPRRPEELFRY